MEENSLEQKESQSQEEKSEKRRSRRRLLSRGVTATAVALGAGAIIETGTAYASGPGTFTSSNPAVPAVKAKGTKGAIGVMASSDTSNALYASNASSSNAAIYGTNTSGDVMHAVNSTTGRSGLFAEGGAGWGVYATSQAADAIHGLATNGSGNGVYGEGFTSTSIGVYGRNVNGGLAGYFEGSVTVNGNLSATGTKNFVQDHPTDPSKEIFYVALEGGEAGTYVRGTGQLHHGKAVIELPEHFALVTNNEDLTVHLTARGTWLQLYVVELDSALLVVREAQGQSGTFDYIIHGVRKGYEQYEVIRSKR